MKFHSPYQFIPIKACENKTGYKNRADLESKTNTHVRHDRWTKEGYSGRINCTLKTVSPLVVGAKQDAGTLEETGVVHPYQPKENPAIPANSLRGMIASIAETLSNSSLRVLDSEEKSTYTVRKEVGDPLKEIGILYKKDNEFYLYALPDPLKIEVYNKKNSDSNFVTSANTYQHQDQSKHFIYATRCEDNFHQVKNLSITPDTNKIKGVLYNRGKYIGSKKYELFIPWDGNIDENSGINVTKQVKALEQTLRRYQDKEHPDNILPQGYNRNWKGDNKEIVISGDLIYFRQDKNQITELSYSQIGRKPVKSNLYQAIERMADKDTLPWNKNRTQLTPAECLFGVVEEKPAADQPARNLASRIQFTDAIASNKITLLPSVTLKILDSPKPPSPAMYFYSRHSKPISKKELDLEKHNPNGRKHYLPQPQVEYDDRKVWQSKFTKENPPTSQEGVVNWKQYLSCTPIPEKAEFHFTIHFENLSQAELGLLQTAIQPTANTDDFIHRLGLGKPLGLGQIILSIGKTDIINRTERYRLKQLNQARYQSHTIAPNTSLIDTEMLELLTTLYNPENVVAPVCYPFNQNEGQQPYNEGEGFSWFVKNDKLKKDNPNKQRLKPIKAHQAIPTLDSFDKD